MILQMAIAVVDPPRFPRVCVNCCHPASTQLEVYRVHYVQPADEESGTASYEVRTAFRPFFCADCVTQHRRELPPFDWNLVVRRILAMWMYLIPAIGSIFFAYVLAPTLIRALVRCRPSDLFF